MKFFLSLLTFLWIGTVICLSQNDMIVVTRLKTDSVSCRIISADKLKINFNTFGDSLPESISTSAVSAITLGETSDQIITSRVISDTIRCKIASIEDETIFYYDNMGADKKSVSKSEVIICHVNQGCSTLVKNVYLNKFQKYHDLYTKIPGNIILDINQSKIQASGIDIDPEKVNYMTLVNGSNTTNSIERNKAKRIIYFEYSYKAPKNSVQTFLLTAGGDLRTCNVQKIDERKLCIEEKVNDTIIKTDIEKEKICALFFSPEENSISMYTSRVEKSAEPIVVPGQDVTFELNITGLLGFRMTNAASQSGYTEGKKMRYGAGTYLNFHTNPSSSFGFTYKYMYAKNPFVFTYEGYKSAENLNYIGVNYQYTPSEEGEIGYDFSFGPGYLLYILKTTFGGESNRSYGHTYGIDLLARLNVEMSEQTAVFFNFSVFVSTLNKTHFEGETYTFDETMNLSRFEVGIGLKFLGK